MDLPHAPLPRTVPALLRRAAAVHPDATALIDPDRDERVSWSALDRLSDDRARALREHGVGPDCVVVLASVPSVEAYIWIHAILKSGAVLAPLHLQFTPGEVAHYLGLLGREFGLVYVVDQPFTPQLAEASEPRARFSFTVESASTSWPALRDAVDPSAPLPELGPEDPAWVIATSGSTSFPKPVLVPHRAAVHIGESVVSMFDLHVRDTMVQLVPLFHSAGLSSFVVGQSITGAATIPMARFDPSTTLDLIERHRIRVLAGIDTHIARIVGLPDFHRGRFASVEHVFYLGNRRFYDILEDLGVRRISTLYGMTEGAIVACTPLEVTDREVRKWSVGVVRPAIDVKIVDPTTRARVPEGEVGEICFRGENLFLRYVGMPDATARAFDDDGFFMSGDLGFEKGGFLYYQGRSKNMVKSGGENVSELEVEDALTACAPGIRQIAVVGAPDDEFGEIVCAFIEWDGEPLSLEHLRDRGRERLAGFKLPRRVITVEPGAWPVVGPGKIDKAALRQYATDRTRTTLERHRAS